jgi:hypothetical protein
MVNLLKFMLKMVLAVFSFYFGMGMILLLFPFLVHSRIVYSEFFWFWSWLLEFGDCWRILAVVVKPRSGQKTDKAPQTRDFHRRRQ